MPFVADFIHDPHSGRPLPAPGWSRNVRSVWAGRLAIAPLAVCAWSRIVAGTHFKGMIAVSLIALAGLVVLGELTAATLRRRRAALAEATRGYVAMIARPFG